MSQGKIRQVNTQAYSEGAVLYADVDTLGGLTQTEPGNGFLKLPIAFVVHSASNGVLAVRVTSGAYMRDLHDVEVTSPATNASLYYNTAQGIWRDTTGAVLTSDTSVFARDFQISGTANYLAKFTGSNAVGNSVAYETGGEIGIGTITPSGKIHISNAANSDPALRILSNSTTSGATHDAVNIDISPGSVSQNVAGVRVATVTASEGSNTGYIARVNARNTSYGVYAEASKIWESNLAGSATGVYGSGTTDSPSGFSYGGYFKNDTTQGTGFGVFVQTTTPKGSGTVTPLAIQHNSTELMRVQSSGNVGIATASPSRPLHVAGTTAIRIPSGNFSQRGTSDNGDIRVRTDTASMEYYSGAWRTIAPMARVPQSGLANRFSKFDANGLLDTSAVLTQSGNNIGIGVTPTERLQVEGTVRATRFNVNTFSTQVLSINNYAPAGSLGGNIYIGTTGLTNTYAGGLDGALNTSLGRDAFSSNTSGYANTAVGREALKLNTDGTQNTAIGFNALQTNASGFLNTAIGSRALEVMTYGIGNTAIGASSLVAFTSGTSNTGVGQSTLQALTTGSSNTAVGLNALDNLTTPNENTAVGFLAGSYAGSGTTKNQTSSRSTYIGYQARAGASGNIGEIVIGTDAVGNGSNTVTIGGSATTATILPAGNLGIAVTSTTARLHLPAGTATANTAPLKFTSGTNLTTPEAGAVEWNGTNVFVTNSSATRQTVNQGLTGSATIDFASTNAQNSRDATITVTGATEGDVVSLGVPNAAVNANTCYTAWVSAANTVTIRFNNYSSGAVDPASATFKVFVTKF